jgi:predicted metal-dependent phosphoesterase TrpH
VAVVPHPFQVSRHGVRRRELSDCDGVEVFNAWAMTGIQNRRAWAFARDHGYPRLGASDAHEPTMVARSYTEVTLPRGVSPSSFTRSDLLDAVRAGETRAAGTSTPTRRYLRKYVRSVELKTNALRRSLSRS